ncbi:MAG: beta-phosphoglucomutase [Planctomycetota bacterium]
MIRGVIFDLDGVLVTTDELHYRSWQKLAAEEDIPFSRVVNQRLRGISRMESLEIILEACPGRYSAEQKQALCDRKQGYYRAELEALTRANLLPGALETVRELRRRGIRTAVGSSSRNTGLILERLGLRELFDVVVDGNDITRAKPEPEVFLLAAERLGLRPAECLVIEDAVAGVESARRAGMAVFGIGRPGELPGVARLAADLAHVGADELLAAGNDR